MSVEKTSLLEINGLKTYKPHKETPVIELEEVEDTSIHNCFQALSTDVFMQLNRKTKNIEFKNNNLDKTKTPLSKKEL